MHHDKPNPVRPHIIKTRPLDKFDEALIPPNEISELAVPKTISLSQIHFRLEEGTFPHGPGLVDPEQRLKYDRELGKKQIADILGAEITPSKLLYTTDNGEILYVSAEKEALLRQLQKHRFNQVKEMEREAPRLLEGFEQIGAIMEHSPIYFTPNSGMLAWRMAARLGAKLAPVTHTGFTSREDEFSLSDVAGKLPYIVSTSWGDPSRALTQACSIAQAMRDNRSLPPVLVAPLLGWARQDRTGVKRTHITPNMIGDFFRKSGVERALTLELHTEQAKSMYGDLHLTHLRSSTLLFKALDDLLGQSREVRDNVVVLTPDIGGIPRARFLARYLDVDYYPIDKVRDPYTRQIEAQLLRPLPRGCIAVSYDDLTDSGSTICQNAMLAKEAGAAVFIAVLAHGPLGKTPDRLQEDPNIDYIIVTDSIGNADVSLYHPVINPQGKFIVPSVAGLFAQAMFQHTMTGQIASNGSINALGKEVIEEDRYLYVNGVKPPCLS